MQLVQFIQLYSAIPGAMRGAMACSFCFNSILEATCNFPYKMHFAH